MEKELIRNEIMRLTVIYKEISKFRIECLKRGYVGTEDLEYKMKVLQNEEKGITSSLDMQELVLYYEEYKDNLTKDELNALARVLANLQMQKNRDDLEGRSL